MPLLNYTTQIQASKTVAEITAILVAHHAQSILTNYYEDGQIKSLSFCINTPQGMAQIVLPVDPDAVLKVMKKWNSHVPARLQNREQSIRVAWRIIKDWVSAQCAILDTEMVKTEQVFLSYIVVTEDKTVFDLYQERFLMLPQGDK